MTHEALLCEEMMGQGMMRHAGHEKNLRIYFAEALLRSILHSASQGLGIGAVLTCAEMMQMNAVQGKGRVAIDSDIYQTLVDNAAAGRQWLAAFDNILSAFQKKYECDALGADRLSSQLNAVIASSEKFRAIKDQILLVDPVVFNGKIRCSTEGFREILSELLLNAFKYSPAKSHIRVLCCSTVKLVSFMVVNETEIMQGGVTGLPPEYQKKVFEPFFRLNNTWDDRFKEQRFGLGIGLTLAESAANACGGSLYTYEIEPPRGAKRVVSELVMEKVNQL